jgi:hypothetical protein
VVISISKNIYVNTKILLLFSGLDIYEPTKINLHQTNVHVSSGIRKPWDDQIKKVRKDQLVFDKEPKDLDYDYLYLIEFFNGTEKKIIIKSQ